MCHYAPMYDVYMYHVCTYVECRQAQKHILIQMYALMYLCLFMNISEDICNNILENHFQWLTLVKVKC